MDITNITAVKVEALPALAEPQEPDTSVDFLEMLTPLQTPAEKPTAIMPVPALALALPEATIETPPESINEIRANSEIHVQVLQVQPETKQHEASTITAPGAPFGTSAPAPISVPEAVPVLHQGAPNQPKNSTGNTALVEDEIPRARAVSSGFFARATITPEPTITAQQPIGKPAPEPQPDLPLEKPLAPAGAIVPGKGTSNRPMFLSVEKTLVIANAEKPVDPVHIRDIELPRQPVPITMAPPVKITSADPIVIPAINPVLLDEFPVGLNGSSFRVDPGHRIESAEITVAGVRIKTPAAEIMAQVVNKLSTRGEPRIELRLDPPELGRVIINLTSVDNTVNAVLTVERPEILDLMRRHIELLSTALKNAGFETANLEFSSGGSDDENTGSQQNQIRPQAADDVVEKPHSTNSILETGRLDIRL